MHKNSLLPISLGLMLIAVLLVVFLSPPGETVLAFNQNNLIRVAEYVKWTANIITVVLHLCLNFGLKILRAKALFLSTCSHSHIL